MKGRVCNWEKKKHYTALQAKSKSGSQPQNYFECGNFSKFQIHTNDGPSDRKNGMSYAKNS